MDTFSHIIIGFILWCGYDIKLGFISGFMGMIVDFDFILYPLSLRNIIFEHRGIAHSYLVVISYTIIFSIIFSLIYSLNFIFTLMAALTGSLAHISCDNLTNYGTYSLYPFRKRPIKLNILLGVDPIIIPFSLYMFIYILYTFLINDISFLYFLCILSGYIYIFYFLIHIILKIIISIKIKTKTLPTLFRVIFIVPSIKIVNENNKTYQMINWYSYNLLNNKKTPVKEFKKLIKKSKPPFHNIDEIISYVFELKPIKRFFSRVEYIIADIIENFNGDEAKLFLYALELRIGKFKYGILIKINKNGNFIINKTIYFKNN